MKHIIALVLIAILAIFSGPRSFAQQDDSAPFVQDKTTPGQTGATGDDPNLPKTASQTDGNEASGAQTGLCQKCLEATLHQKRLDADNTNPTTNGNALGTAGSSTPGDR